MAEIISQTDITKTKRNIDDIDKALNTKGKVKPLWGAEFHTLPSAIQMIIDAGGFTPFSTEAALLQSIPVVLPSAAKALDTKKIWIYEARGGIAKWWDTGLSDLDLAIQYLNSKILNNIFDPSFQKAGYFVSESTGNLEPFDGCIIAIIPIQKNQDYFLKSEKFADGFAISALNSKESLTALNKIALQNTTNSDIKSFKVTNINAHYVAINIKVPTIDFDISESLMIKDSFEKISKVTEIGGIEIADEIARKNMLDVRILGDNLYQKSTMIKQGFYLSLTENTVQPYIDWSIAVIPIKQNTEYQLTTNTNEPFKFGLSNNSEIFENKALVVPTFEKEGDTIYFKSTNESFLFVNAYIVGAGFDYNTVDIISVVESNKVSASEVSAINNMSLADTMLRNTLASTATRFRDKKFLTFGDSITEGTQGGYVKYLAAVLQCDLVNHGSSGAKADRLQRIMTGQPSRDEATASWNFPIIDYSDVAGITIMIGTNDAADWNTQEPIGSIGDIPVARIEDAADPNVFLQSFPNTFFGNLAMCIEYVKWKNPNIEIHLITSPMNAQHSASMRQIRLHQIEIAQYYGVNLIDAQNLCGIGLKDVPKYTYDNLHFNEEGNKRFGEYIARQIAVS